LNQKLAPQGIPIPVKTTCSSVFAVKQMSPRLLRRAGLVILAFATSLLIAAATLGGLSILLVGLAFFTFACGIIMPNATAAAMASQPEISGAASGVVGAAQFISGAAAAAIVGIFYPKTVGGMVSIMAVFASVSVVLGITLDRRRSVSLPPAPGIKATNITWDSRSGP
jgi:MFS transporter, DHA1 family, multidrug resistance protein